MKVGQVIGDDKEIAWLTFEQIPSNFPELRPFANLGISNLSARFLENHLR